MKRSKSLMFGVLLLAAMFLAVPPRADAAGLILEPMGEHNQTLNAQESVSYQWFIYNGLNRTFLLRISANVTSGPEWSSSFDTSLVLLKQGQSVFVNLTVESTGDVERRVVNQSVMFLFEDIDNPIFTFLQLGYAETTMVPIWGALAPGKNKILWEFENPLPAPFDNNYATFLLNVGIWAAIALALAYLVGPAMRLFTKRTKTDLDDRILKILHVPIFILVIVFGLVSSFAILPLNKVEVRTIYDVYGIVLIAVVTFVVY